jgi:N-acetylneuraminate synthase
MGFTLEQWHGVKKHCDEVGLEFMSSPFSNAAVDLLEEVGIKRYKIGSGEVNNYLMLEKIARTGKDIILSSGMSDYEEIGNTIEFIKQFNQNISVMQCTTMYPTPAEETGLNTVVELKKRFGLPVGLSDHSGTIYPSIAAAALGAELFEIHVVFDKRCFGPDSTSSLTVDELKQLVEGVNFVRTGMSQKDKKDETKRFDQVKGMFEKTLAVNRDVEQGEEIQLKDLEAKKPSNRGVSARFYSDVVGRKAAKRLSKWDFITEEDLI